MTSAYGYPEETSRSSSYGLSDQKFKYPLGQKQTQSVVNQFQGLLGQFGGQPPASALEKYLGERVKFQDVDPKYYGLNQPVEQYQNNADAQIMAGQQQALREFDRGRSMGTSSNPYARSSGGTTRDAIMQRAQAQSGLSRAQIGMDYGQRAAGQGLAATDLQRQVDIARMQQELQRPQSLAALLAAHVPYAQSIAGPLAQLVGGQLATKSESGSQSVTYG